MNKKLLAALHEHPLYRTRQTQLITYLSLTLNFILIVALVLVIWR